MAADENKRVAVVGGGLVGSLNTCYLAHRGFLVDLYEQRSDIRVAEHVKGRSINLALSLRGREALKRIGLEEKIVNSAIPMYSRMIHNVNGSCYPIPYGKKEQYILSVDRRKLNEDLLTAAEKNPNVTLKFSHKLSSCDFKSKELNFVGSDTKETFDLLVGTDGAFSAVRRVMMKNTLLNYAQEYIPHGYMELIIPPLGDGQFQMEVNHLHLWPRNELMMIALPNQGGSFTVTLFMPFTIFNSLTNDDDVIRFFEDNFPDAVPLIGKQNIKDTFNSTKALPMVSIKTFPYHLDDSAVIMGDAAHAMVPFYGQGMNCGFEDCIVLDDLMQRHSNDVSKVLPEYSRIRSPDAAAICDLAMYNYIEMRSSVNSKLFLIRKKLDNFLNWLMPNTWIPLYSMVAFTRMPYTQCVIRRQWQDKVINRSINTAVFVAVVLAAWNWKSSIMSSFDQLVDKWPNLFQ